MCPSLDPPDVSTTPLPQASAHVLPSRLEPTHQGKAGGNGGRVEMCQQILVRLFFTVCRRRDINRNVICLDDLSFKDRVSDAILWKILMIKTIDSDVVWPWPWPLVRKLYSLCRKKQLPLSKVQRLAGRPWLGTPVSTSTKRCSQPETGIL